MLTSAAVAQALETQRYQALPSRAVARLWLTELAPSLCRPIDADLRREAGVHDRIHLFGRPRLSRYDSQVINIPPAAWRLLAIIAAQPRATINRSDLMEIIWGASKNGALRKLLWNVREIERISATHIIGIDNTTVSLLENVYSDVQDLLAAHPKEPLSKIYRGVYADGIVGDHPAWTAWLNEQRQALRSIYVEKATAALRDPDVARAATSREARHLLQIDPTNELALRAQMVVDAIDGDMSGIKRDYRRMEDRLRGVESRPEQPTRDLYQRLTSSSDLLTDSDAGVPTICILPPAPRTRTAAYRLAQSLVVDVTIGLCRNTLLKVIAPHTAGRIKVPEDVTKIDTSYLVAIDMIDHASGGQYIVFSLVSSGDQHVLWTDRIEVADDYSVDVYNLLSEGVLRSIIRNVDHDTISAYALQAEPSAYSAFVVGQASLETLDLRELRRGRAQLRRAVDRSPRFAPASAALARSYQMEWILTARGDADLLARAEHYARAAIAADPYEARGFRELAFCHLYAKRYTASIDQYARAEQLNPHYADLLAYFADALVHDGQVEMALAKINKAISLNPMCQDSYFWTKAAALYFLEDYKGAISNLRQMQNQVPALRLLAAAYAMIGDLAAASRCRTQAIEVYPDLTIEKWINIVPLRDHRHILHYKNGLLAAGFT